MDTSGDDVAVVIPAKDEVERIGATVAAARTLPGVRVVVVVDDGSGDGTAWAAEEAGATTLRHGRNLGKGAAMVTGAEAVRLLDRYDGRATPRHLLFLDADLEASATGAAPLVAPVRGGAADMTIAVLVARQPAGGGRGCVVGLARGAIRRATGWRPVQPLSGQRCLTRPAFDAARPLASGFGVETALTIDLLRQGFRVEEVPVPLRHRVTGADWRAQRHRARQFLHVARALAVRRLPAGAVRWLRDARGMTTARRALG